jgi:hypothetical protein
VSDDELVFEIGMVGPSGVGKTSLISAIFLAGQDMLAGSGVTVVPDDDATAGLMADHAHALAGLVQAEQFVGEALRATTDVTDFHLRLDPGVPDGGVGIHVEDYPGGWLDPKARERSEKIRQGWEPLRDFMQRSSVLLVPVDATVLMQALTPRRLKAVPHLLRIHDTMQVLRAWAQGRAAAPESPALLIFVPVKGESYLRPRDDHGSRGDDRSRELFERFRGTYADCIQAVRAEARHITMLYLPVDTLGCVDLVFVTWPQDPDTGVRCEPTFRIINHGERDIRGVDDLLVALCRTLVEARRKAVQVHEHQLREKHGVAVSYARRDRGLVGNFLRVADRFIASQIGRDELIRITERNGGLTPLEVLGWIGLGRAARDEQAAEQAQARHLRATTKLRNLQQVVDDLAQRDYSNRVRHL